MPSTQNAVLIFVQTGVRTYLKIVGSVWNRYMTRTPSAAWENQEQAVQELRPVYSTLAFLGRHGE
jgi:hypothetical protein